MCINACMEPVFILWPTLSEMADSLGGPKYQTVASWKRRNFLPPEYDTAIVTRARVVGNREITFEWLACVRAAQKGLPDYGTLPAAGEAAE